MKQVPFNTTPDGLCRTLKAQYYKNGFKNMFLGGVFGATAVAVYEEGVRDRKK